MYETQTASYFEFLTNFKKSQQHLKTEVYHPTCTTEPVYVKNFVYVISMLSYGLSQTIDIVSVNYLKYIFTSKIKKTEIVRYVHENMI